MQPESAQPIINYLPVPASMGSHVPANDALKNRIVVITGATGGLGTALGKSCAAHGATVVLLGKDIKKLEALYDVLENIDNAPQPAIVPVNQAVANEDDYATIARTLQDEFGRIDSLVHTAAELGVLTPQSGIAQQDWSRIMSVKFTSARLLSNACLPLLDASDNASIVFTIDHKPGAYWGAYGIANTSLLYFAHMLADETDNQLDNEGAVKLAINSIDPGPMRTQLRRKAFPGELKTETEPPESRTGCFLSMITRQDKHMHGVCVKHDG